ncbi:amidohydrolase family protein [Variovorax rhizosphaerae]|uniref:Amidohydrolase family protein n=1 Tax=Variovorax rhizosphaerae TaxID=1836200 RepID=A0ABU8WTA7_9BURK
MTITGIPRRANEDWLSLMPPEAPLEPALPIVDPHVHLRDKGFRYFIEEYARDIAESGHNIEAMVYAEGHAMYRRDGPEHLKCVGETEFAVGQAAMGASGKYTSTRVAAGIVGFADLTLGERTRETLEAHVRAGHGRFSGVRQRAKWDPDPAVRGPISADAPGLYLTPEFGKGLDVLTAMELSFDASIFHPQLADVTALARSHPDANIVLIHSGSPVTHSSYAGRPVHADWLAGMRELATCPNVSVKMGGLLACVGDFDPKTAQRPSSSEELAMTWRPYIEPCIELFGAERCMASSNFPVDAAGMRYGTLWNAFKRITSGCTADEKQQIYAATAKRVYRLER